MISDATLVERTWTAAHAATAFPGWTAFQIAAVVLGAALVAHQGGRRLVVPYLVAVAFAVVGALLLGSGAGWIAWLARGRLGSPPPLETAGLGAIAGLVTGQVLATRRRGISIGRGLDALAPSIGLMIAVARIGCFFAGCDFGTPSSLPWALRYPPMTPAFRTQLDAGLIHADALHTLPVHPSQLYEAVLGALVLVATLAVRSPHREGDRFALTIVLYAGGRIVLDVLRGDLVHGGALGLTVSQGLALALAGLVLAWRANGRTSAADPAAAPRSSVS